MYILSLFNKIAHLGDFILNLLRKILILLDALVYSLVGFVYRIFNVLVLFNPFDESVYNDLVTRIYTLLGIVMLFVLVYTLLQGIINPDDMDKKDSSPQKFLLNVVVSIGLMVIMPTVFRFTQQFIGSIVNGGVIPNIILGKPNYTMKDGEESNAKTGYMIAMYAYDPFFAADQNFCETYVYRNSDSHSSLNRAYGIFISSEEKDGLFTSEKKMEPVSANFTDAQYLAKMKELIPTMYPFITKDDIDSAWQNYQSKCEMMILINQGDDADQGQIPICKKPSYRKATIYAVEVDISSCDEYYSTEEYIAINNLWVAKQIIMETGDFALLTRYSKKTFNFFDNIPAFTGDEDYSVFVKPIFQSPWGQFEEVQSDNGQKTENSATSVAQYTQTIVQNRGVQQIKHLFPVSLIVGCFLVYVFISFCFDMGKRVVRLLFLQLIAPIPIIARIIPSGKDIFSKWVKKLISVYLEVIIRLVAVFFGIFLIKNIIDNPDIWNKLFDGESNFLVIGLAKAFIIMGIVAFMKELPKFLGDLFPGMNSDGMSLGIKDKLKEGGAFAAAGFVGGATVGTARNMIHSWANKNNWQNKKDKVTFGSALRNVSKGLRSGVAGGVSAGVRAAKNGDVKSFKDVGKNITSSVEASEAARNKRETVYAENGHNTARTIGYQAKDGLRRFGAYMGYKSPAEREAENKAIKEAADALKVSKDNIEAAILDAANKNKNYTFGSKKHNTVELKRLYEAMNAAQLSEDPQARINAQKAYEEYKKGFVDEIRGNVYAEPKAFKSYMETGAGSLLSTDERVVLYEANKDAENVKHVFQKQNGTRFILESNKAAVAEYIYDKNQVEGIAVRNAAANEFDNIIQVGTNQTLKTKAETEFNTNQAASAEATFRRMELAAVQADFDANRKAVVQADFDNNRVASVNLDFDTNRLANVRVDFDSNRVSSVRSEFDSTQMPQKIEEFNKTVRSSVETDFDNNHLDAAIDTYNAKHKKSAEAEFEGRNASKKVSMSSEEYEAEKARFVDEKRTAYVDEVKKQYVQAKQNDYVDQARTTVVNAARDEYINVARNEYVNVARNEYVNVARNEYVNVAKDQYIDVARNKYVDDAKKSYIDDAVNKSIAAKAETITVEEMQRVFDSGAVTEINYHTINNGTAFITEKDANGNVTRLAAGDSTKNVGREITAVNEIELNRLDNIKDTTEKK